MWAAGEYMAGLRSVMRDGLWSCYHILNSWHLVPPLHGKLMGKQWKQWQTLFSAGERGELQNHWSHEIKRHLLLGRKVMTNLGTIFKSRDITWPTNVCVVKAMIFFNSHVWIWELDYKESWAPKNLCFWTVMLEKTLESPLDCKEIQPVHPKGNHSFEGLMLKLKLSYFGLLMWWTDSFEKTWCWERLNEGGEGDNRGWDGWMASPTQWTWVWVDPGSWWWTGRPGVLWFMGSQRVGHDWATELNWKDVSFPFSWAPWTKIWNIDKISFYCILIPFFEFQHSLSHKRTQTHFLPPFRVF